MFERFTERARRMMIAAQHHAAELGHGEVATEHVLLALMGESEGTAAHILDLQAVSGDAVRARLLDLHPPLAPAEALDATRPLTTEAKDALEAALAAATDLDEPVIGTEHLLLGLIREPVGIGGLVLRELGMTEDGVRTDIAALRDAKASPGRSGFWRRRRIA